MPPYVPFGMVSLCPSAALKGRPRAFDLDDALAAALRVFWQHGYESASMAELTAAMGITKPSLYAAFGNKEALFHKAMDLYEREKLAYISTALEAPTARGVAERLLRGALELQTCAGNPKGCLGVIATVSCGAEAESIKAEVIARRASSQAALLRRFAEAEAAGELPDGMTPDALAQYLFALLAGLTIQAGAGASCSQLDTLVDTAMAMWPTR